MPLKYPKEEINRLIAEIKSGIISDEIKDLKENSDIIAGLKLEEHKWSDEISPLGQLIIGAMEGGFESLFLLFSNLVKSSITGKGEMDTCEKISQLKNVKKYCDDIYKMIKRMGERTTRSIIRGYAHMAPHIIKLDCPDIDVVIDEKDKKKSVYFSDVKIISEIIKLYFSFFIELRAKYKSEEHEEKKKSPHPKDITVTDEQAGILAHPSAEEYEKNMEMGWIKNKADFEEFFCFPLHYAACSSGLRICSGSFKFMQN